LCATGHGVARRIEQLEHQIGVVLFTRHRDGVRLTADGQHLVSCAEQMEAASLGFTRRRGKLAILSAGKSGLRPRRTGTFWITPRLLEFARRIRKF